MGLSIKDADTERLVRELAQRRGTGVTGAIRLAVSNDLSRDDEARERDFERLWADIQEIQRQFAEGASGKTLEEIEADMYDENGAPR